MLNTNYTVMIMICLFFLRTTLVADELVQIEPISNEKILKEDTSFSKNLRLKGRGYIRDGIVTGKLRFQVERVWSKSNYVKKIIAKVKDKRVLEVYFNKSNPSSWFVYKFKDFTPYFKNIDYTIFDNHNNKVNQSFKIKRKGRSKELIFKDKENSFKKINSKIWELTSVDDVIKEFYGQKALKSFHSLTKTDKYNIEGNCSSFYFKKNKVILPCGGTSIIIDSKKELDSILLFNTGNRFPLMTLFKIPMQSIHYIRTKYRLRNYDIAYNRKIIVVAKGRDGKIYRSKDYFIENSKTCGSGDGCESNYMKFKIQ